MWIFFSFEPDDDEAVGRRQDVGGLQLREREHRQHHPQRDRRCPVHGNVGKRCL